MPSQEGFLYLLLFTFKHRLVWLLEWAAVVIAGLILVWRPTSVRSQGAGRRWKRARDQQRRDDKACISVGLGFVGVILLAFIWVYPPLKDYQSNSIVYTEAIYTRDANDYHKGTPNVGGSVYLTVNGETFSVELYPGFSENDFPEGTFSATVAYGESSKILLDLEIH